MSEDPAPPYRKNGNCPPKNAKYAIKIFLNSAFLGKIYGNFQGGNCHTKKAPPFRARLAPTLLFWLCYRRNCLSVNLS